MAFCATAAQEFMACADEDEAENSLTRTAYFMQGHAARPITKEHSGKNIHTAWCVPRKKQSCMSA